MGIRVVIWAVFVVVFCDGKMQEMTHLLKQGAMAKFPSHTPFTMEINFAGKWNEYIPWAAMNDIALGEHIGTHLDAPYHFHEQGKKLHEIALSRFEGPAVVIDITQRAEVDPNANVTVEDLQAWERVHGKIPDGAWILMNSGWKKYWPDQMTFVGTNDSDIRTYNFPAFSPEAAEWIAANRPKISGIAVDTISCDNGNRTQYGYMPVHVLLLPLDILCVEIVNHADKIPIAGATFHVWPINIFEGTGAPSRAYATWGEEDADCPSSSGSEHLSMNFVAMSLTSLLLLLLKN